MSERNDTPRSSSNSTGDGTGTDAVSAALARAVVAHPPCGLYLLDDELRLVHSAKGPSGPSPAHGWHELGLDEAEPVVRMLREVLHGGEAVDGFHHEGPPPDAADGADGAAPRTLSLSASRLTDADGQVLGVAVTVADVTEERSRNRRLDLLRTASQRIGTTLDIFTTAQEAADVAVSALADVAAVEVLDSVTYGHAPAPGPVLDRVALRRAGFARAGSGSRDGAFAVGDVRIMRYGTPYTQVLADLRPRMVYPLHPEDPWLARDPGQAELARRARVHSLMAVPMTARGVVLGIVTLYRVGDSPPFTDSDLEAATELTAHAATGVDSARRYTREHTLVRLVQHSMVPTQLPVQVALETAYSYLPVAAGGTWFDVLPLSGARAALMVGHVGGSGIRAVAAMGQLRAAASALAAMDLPPDELLVRLHELVVRLGEDPPPPDDPDVSQPLAATCLVAAYDPVSGQCDLANAAHAAPVLLSPGEPPEAMEVPAGPSLGQGAPAYPLTTVDLPEASILALYNAGTLDGLTEALRELRVTSEDSLQSACDTLVSRLLPPDPTDDVLLLMSRTRLLAPDRVASHSLPNDLGAPAAARAWVNTQLADWGLEEMVPSTELVASELVTNAVRYSTGPIGLRLIRDQTLSCEVTDSSGSSPHLRHAGDEDERGRGLYLVAHLTEHWGTRLAGTGKTIWTEQALPSEGRAPAGGTAATR
ncbi:SpoIIE family protein phosphatase [Streptomyces sp. 4N509B]|uniref:SpoIIE family protein phosphatase n=1 Tax=Streptomyces sp. 4N509B TaxID=3457413 RepID=UPI003FD5596F